MMEEHDIRGQLDALNPTLSPPSINLEEAYDFASLLFSPPQLTVVQNEQTNETINPPTLPETNNQNHQMSRMRGQVESTTKDSRTRKVFDRTTMTPLEI
jgi:hypothetical protein